MTKIPNKLFMSIVILCAAFMLQTANAEQALVSVTGPDQLAIQLPVVDRKDLIEQIRRLRSQLIQRKQALVQIVADRRLDSSDAVITAILPGGLLYAGYKKIRYEQAKNELVSINEDIEEFSDDLLTMQSRPEQVVIARLP